MRLFMFIPFIFSLSCNAQNDITSNEIVRSKDYKVGVKTSSGKLIIDTIYSNITPMNRGGEITLPPKRGYTHDPINYYQVRKEDNELAIFNSGGDKVFDFSECRKLFLDDKSKTIVKTTFVKGEGERNQLYNLQGKLIFERDYELIAYIENSPLIALIAEDGPNEEYYIYHPTSKKQFGPYTHFNIYGQNGPPLFGMTEEAMQKYRGLDVIMIRTEKNNDYIWGMIDLEGNEIFPIEYKYFRVVEAGMQKRFIDPAEKPEGVNFLFYSHKFDGGPMLLLDKEMNIYEYDNDSRVITKKGK